MRFLNDLGKLLILVLGLILILMNVGWITGAKSNNDKTEYYLYEHEIADDFNEKDNAPWNTEIRDSI